MITFKQFLTELFDKPFNYKHHTTPNGNIEYRFHADDKQVHPYVVYIGNDKLESGKTEYSIVLSYKGPTKYSEFRLTNRKEDQFRVLATVKNIILSHFDRVKLWPGDTIDFDTFDPSTAKIYTKFAQELANRTKTNLQYRDKIGGHRIFILTK